MVARSFKKKSWSKRCLALLMLSIITAMPLLASGCSQSRDLCDEDGNMWRFTLGEVYKTSEIYVKDGDAYSPLLSYGLYLKGNSGERDATRFVWLAGNKLETLIPDIGDERQLVLFSHDANPEKSYKIEHFTDAGYTLGTIFKTNSLGQISFSKDAEDYSAGSTMYQAKRAAITNPAASSVRELNGMDFPYDNICSDGYMTGLESMGTYRIGFYEGTRFKQIQVQADTHIWYSDSTYEITAYQETKSGYFILRLPDNIPAGLYYLNGVGLFTYSDGVLGYMPPQQGEVEDSSIPSKESEAATAPIVDSIGFGNPSTYIPEMEVDLIPEQEGMPLSPDATTNKNTVLSPEETMPSAGILTPGNSTG